MKNNILISIITPCFNSEKTIQKTLDSVLNQTYQNFEYIIIDGKSTDNTLKIIDNYKKKFGSRLKVISESDKGIYDAMNKGITMATGDLIGIVNSDDYYENDALENIVSSYDGSPYAVVYGMERDLINGKEQKVWIKSNEFINEQMINHPACFITKKLYDKYGVYNLEYKYSADYEFMIRISRKKEIKFIKVYKIISNFVLGGASSTRKAYIETLKLKYYYGLVSKKKYYLTLFKTKIAILIKGNVIK